MLVRLKVSKNLILVEVKLACLLNGVNYFLQTNALIYEHQHTSASLYVVRSEHVDTFPRIRSNGRQQGAPDSMP